MSEEFTTLDKFHEEVDSIFVLENIIHANYERMFNIEENILFKLNVVKLLIVDNSVLSNTLHSIYVFSVNIFDQENLTKSTFSNHSSNDKILKLSLVLLLGED